MESQISGLKYISEDFEHQSAKPNISAQYLPSVGGGHKTHSLSEKDSAMRINISQNCSFRSAFHNPFWNALNASSALTLINKIYFCGSSTGILLLKFSTRVFNLSVLIKFVINVLVFQNGLQKQLESTRSSNASRVLLYLIQLIYKLLLLCHIALGKLFLHSGLLLTFLLILVKAVAPANGIRITSVMVPHHQKSGQPVQLECHYDLEGDDLYSVKWYRGLNEFFRFVPAEKNPMQIFELPGVLVDTALSDSRKVTLRSVSRDSSGKYKCEVSADFPSFHTVSKAAEMLVVDMSNSVPNITGGRTRYHVGDEVHFNCTSAKSRPAASLMWYINDEQAKSDQLVEYAPTKDDDGLETSRLGLRFLAGAKDFPKGLLKIRCTATVAAVYWNSAEQAVEGHLPQTSPALESKGVYTGGGPSQLMSRTRDIFLQQIPIIFLSQKLFR